jgi:hypothetical protein
MTRNLHYEKSALRSILPMTSEVSAMFARTLATGVVLALAIAAFFGAGPMSAGPLNPCGLLLLFVAFLVWRYWRMARGDYSPALFDGITRPIVAPGSVDDHYRSADDSSQGVRSPFAPC